MKLYHYAPLDNTVLSDGLLSTAKLKKDLSCYVRRAGSNEREMILQWLDKTFPGRSRSVSCLTEPIKWQGNDPVLKSIADTSALFSFEGEALVNSGEVEAVWCKDGSQANGFAEKFYPVQFHEIDVSPLPWEKCNSDKGVLYAVIRHYLIVLKSGVLPPQYLRLEEMNAALLLYLLQ